MLVRDAAGASLEAVETVSFKLASHNIDALAVVSVIEVRLSAPSLIDAFPVARRYGASCSFECPCQVSRCRWGDARLKEGPCDVRNPFLLAACRKMWLTSVRTTRCDRLGRTVPDLHQVPLIAVGLILFCMPACVI